MLLLSNVDAEVTSAPARHVSDCLSVFGNTVWLYHTLVMLLVECYLKHVLCICWHTFSSSMGQRRHKPDLHFSCNASLVAHGT